MIRTSEVAVCLPQLRGRPFDEFEPNQGGSAEISHIEKHTVGRQLTSQRSPMVKQEEPVNIDIRPDKVVFLIEKAKEFDTQDLLMGADPDLARLERS
jgi:hypothetical protein